MGGFRPLGARLRTLALPFDKCTAPVKLPAWQGLQIGSRALFAPKYWRVNALTALERDGAFALFLRPIE